MLIIKKYRAIKDANKSGRKGPVMKAIGRSKKIVEKIFKCQLSFETTI